MQITRATDYAVRVLIHMASLPPGTRVMRTELAEVTAVAENFLSKVLQTLARANMLVSRRGPEGGFELSQAAEFITMLDVIQAMEGPVCLNVCLGRDGACVRRESCSAHNVWLEAQSAMVEVLRKATIAELAGRYADSEDRSQSVNDLQLA